MNKSRSGKQTVFEEGITKLVFGHPEYHGDSDQCSASVNNLKDSKLIIAKDGGRRGRGHYWN